jgi:hypothetical protein
MAFLCVSETFDFLDRNYSFVPIINLILTNSLENSASCGANSCSTGQEIIDILCKAKIHCRVRKN